MKKLFKHIVKLFKRILRIECKHTFSYFYSIGFRKCVDCGKVEPITNVIKSQR